MKEGIDIQPISNVEWIDPNDLHSNDYNPNYVFGPERELLKRSLLEDGWTQPIVARHDGEIVDGFHRWTIAKTDDEVSAMTEGMVPVVRMYEEHDRARQILSTVRHNRARGKHGILKMSDIIKELTDLGLDESSIEQGLGMEKEERERLSETRTSPELAGRDSFGKGWVPKPSRD